MKKMFVSIALFVMICLTFSGCIFIPFQVSQRNEVDSTEEITAHTEAPTELEPDYTLYKPYMQEVLDNLPDNDYARALGILYDVGSNGVDELIMIYDSNTVKHPDYDMVGMAVAFSVYTIEDNKVVEIEDEHFLFPLAGGPQGSAYIIDGYEETLLGFKYAEVNPGENDMVCLGNWYIYSVDGPDNNVNNYEDKFPEEVEYFYHYNIEDGYENIDYSKESRATSKSDDRDSTYDWFHKWLSENKPTEILRYSLDNEEQSLEALMSSLG